MIYALASLRGQPLVNTGTDGTLRLFVLPMNAVGLKTETVEPASINFQVSIPMGSKRARANEIISDTTVMEFATQLGWTLDPSNLLFQPFDTGQ